MEMWRLGMDMRCTQRLYTGNHVTQGPRCDKNVHCVPAHIGSATHETDMSPGSSRRDSYANPRYRWRCTDRQERM